MKFYSIVPIVMSVMLLSACGGSSGGDDGDDSSSTTTPDSTQPPAEVAPLPIAKDLQGKWKRHCTYHSKDSYTSQFFSFSGNEYDYSRKFYEDSNCYSLSNAVSEYVESGVYVVGSVVTTSSGVKANNIDFRAEFINGKASSAVVKNIYKVDGYKMYLQTSSGSNTLDFSNPFYKQ